MRILQLAGGMVACVAFSYGRDVSQIGAPVEAALGPEVPAVGPFMAVSGESYNPELHKPKVSEVFKPLMYTFERPQQSAPLCADVVDGLADNDGTSDAHVSLTVVLGLLNGENQESDTEAVSTDKNMEVVLTELAGQMIREGSSDGRGDLVHYMDTIINCIVDRELGRTMIQSMIAKGMEKSLKTAFVSQLMRGSLKYDPATALDNAGDTLMHLAVMSKGVSVPKTVMHLEQDRNKYDKARKMNIIYWMLSCLQHRNDDGMRPLDLCDSTTMADELKRTFRSYTLYFKIRAKQLGVSTDVLDEAGDLLQTSGTLAANKLREAAEKNLAAPVPVASLPVAPQVAAAA